jgi:3-oxoadipate CoA-transferase, alpha subunit
MIDKQCATLREALAGVRDGSIVLVSGFGDAGMPFDLIAALIDQGARDLTLVANNAGVADDAVAQLMDKGRVRKIVCSFPNVGRGAPVFDRLYASGALELELVPQGTLSERIRAGAAGLGGFFTRTGAGTQLAEGKETREIDGKLHVFEKPIVGDLALLAAHKADRWGNLVYRYAERNFGPDMAAAGKLTVAQVTEIVPLGSLAPDTIATPGIYVDRVVVVTP